MKSIFDKKLSSKLSEKVSSKTIKEMLKDFYKMLRLECLVDFEQLKSEILQKEQELLKEQANRIFDDIFLDSDSNQLEDYDDCVLTYNEFINLKKRWLK